MVKTPDGYHLVTNSTEWFAINEDGWKGPRRVREQEAAADARFHALGAWPPPPLLKEWFYGVGGHYGRSYEEIVTATSPGTFPTCVTLQSGACGMTITCTRSGQSSEAPAVIVRAICTIADMLAVARQYDHHRDELPSATRNVRALGE